MRPEDQKPLERSAASNARPKPRLRRDESDAVQPGATPPSRETESRVRLVLELLGRAQRERVERARLEAQHIQPGLSLSELREWLNRERYVYAEPIAKGGMARIYCAADLHLCRTVALKTLLDNPSKEAIGRFLYEAQIAAQLQHPNVIPIYDVGLDPQTQLPFLVMKLVTGRTLLDIILGLRQKAPEMRRYANIAERIGIFLKVCDAIAYAHAHQVIHRDIKPASIMVGDYGEVYVIDWGIAESRGRVPPSDPDTGRLRFDRTRVSTFHDVYRLSDPGADKTFMGSPVHMAPEQIVDPDGIDERSDIYGLGCTLYELVTLRAPFRSTDSIDKLLQSKRVRDYPPAWKYTPSAKYGLSDIIDRCLAPCKSRRYKSVRSLQNALRRYLQRVIKSRVPSRLQAIEKWVQNLDAGEMAPSVRQELLKRLRRASKDLP